VIADEELAKDFKALLEPLTSAVGPIGKDLEFYLAKSDTLNAFAIPGGKIVVNSKTILEAGRLEELYGVLAHEISHVSERHTARQIITVFGIYTVVDLVLGSGLGTVAAVTQGASYLLQQGFSREQERDADLHALQYLRAAQIDPHGMIEFFQRIEKEYSKDNPLGGLERSVAFFSTHPATSDRIEEIKALIASEPTLTYRSFDTEVFNAFKKKLRTYLEMH
jgi:predicted Zn-dependent protease